MLKKGDLVMTEEGLGLYGYLRAGGTTHRVDLLDGRQDVLCEKAEAQTRPQVEAYLKEKGWNKEHSTFGSKDYYLHLTTKEEGYRVWQKSPIASNTFDTAPAQQAEAILMARLLNATKD